jgi:hypothetical protein
MAGELLREIQTDTSLPAQLRQQATVVLRHYPSAREIQSLASLCEHSTEVGPLWLSSRPTSESD